MESKISLFYIIPAVFILLMIFPIFVEIRVSFNPFFNRGVVSLFVFKKQIFYYLVSFNGKYIELQNKDETKMKKIDFESQEFAVMEEFGRQLKDKIRLKKLYVFYNIGTGDAYSSALVCGVLNQVLMQVFLYIKNHKPTASLCVYDTVSYNKAKCEVAGRVLVSISFFEVVYSWLYSVIITKKK